MDTSFNEIAIVDRSIIDLDEIKIIQTFLYGYPTYSINDNKLILDTCIKYILGTKRFVMPYFEIIAQLFNTYPTLYFFLPLLCNTCLTL